MIDILDSIYSYLKPNNTKLTSLFYSSLRYLTRLSAILILPLYFYLTKNNKRFRLSTAEKTSARIIVSLTTFPGRINQVWLVIETILRQTKKPDLIILYLSKCQFPGKQALPKKLLSQEKRGLNIIFVQNDLKSHKKYFYSIKTYPNDFIITIDDDIFYRTKMIENLYNDSLKYPRTVIAQYCKKMTYNNNILSEYCKWTELERETSPTYNNFFGSGGGTLFPPKSLLKDITNENLFMSLCPTADDIWLNAMCRVNKVKIRKANCSNLFLPIINGDKETLDQINNGMNQNDIQITKVTEYYKKTLNQNIFSENYN